MSDIESDVFRDSKPRRPSLRDTHIPPPAQPDKKHPLGFPVSEADSGRLQELMLSGPVKVTPGESKPSVAASWNVGAVGKPPPHYAGKGGMQPFHVIDAFNLSFYEGSVVKYVLRWRKKGGVEDLRKARHFLDEIILRAEQELEDKEEDETPVDEHVNCAYCKLPIGCMEESVVVGGGEVHEDCAIAMSRTT